jgi:hypothetical protein
LGDPDDVVKTTSETEQAMKTCLEDDDEFTVLRDVINFVLSIRFAKIMLQ